MKTFRTHTSGETENEPSKREQLPIKKISNTTLKLGCILQLVSPGTHPRVINPSTEKTIRLSVHYFCRGDILMTNGHYNQVYYWQILDLQTDINKKPSKIKVCTSQNNVIWLNYFLFYKFYNEIKVNYLRETEHILYDTFVLFSVNFIS